MKPIRIFVVEIEIFLYLQELKLLITVIKMRSTFANHYCSFKIHYTVKKANKFAMHLIKAVVLEFGVFFKTKF